MDGAERPGWTMGVEEEFLLVDPGRGTTVPLVDDVLAGAGPAALPDGAALHRELRASQVEAATGVCSSAEQLREHLRAGRRVLANAAHAVGAVVVPVANPPLRHDTEPSAAVDPRYAQIDRVYAGLVADYEACGQHVHIGVADRDQAVAVVNHVNRWLPTLLALSGNSPFHDGRDTGYESWRIVQQSRFPGAGLAPHTVDHAAWQDRIARLVDCGVLVDHDQTFWFARPSPRLPTVEFRVADTAATLDGAIVQALLCRALVRTALADLDRGRTADPVPEPFACAAVWSAARHGLAGPGIDLARCARVPATELLRGLLAHTRDALAETGDLAAVRAWVRQPHTGAQRQRDLAGSGGLADLPARMALATGHDINRPNRGMSQV